MTGEAVGCYGSSFSHAVTRGRGVIYGRAPSTLECAVPSKLGIPAALARPPPPGCTRESWPAGCVRGRGSCALRVPRLP